MKWKSNYGEPSYFNSKLSNVTVKYEINGLKIITLNRYEMRDWMFSIRKQAHNPQKYDWKLMKKTNEKNTVVHDKMKPIITIMVSYLIRV